MTTAPQRVSPALAIDDDTQRLVAVYDSELDVLQSQQAALEAIPGATVQAARALSGPELAARVEAGRADRRAAELKSAARCVDLWQARQGLLGQLEGAARAAAAAVQGTIDELRKESAEKLRQDNPARTAAAIDLFEQTVRSQLA